MYRLLIVDNEEYVVNGLVELFRQEKELELEVTGVYSAAEALNVLMTTRMDIVLSDIRMPGMNGLELHKIVMSRWPHCKFIFLSGYDDFGHAQQAIRQGSINYILKTEEDEVIVGAVREAIDRIRADKEAGDVLQEAKRQLKHALTALQREFLEGVLMGDLHAFRSLERQLADLQIPLHPNKPLLAVVGKVDEWKPDYSYYDRSLMLYAIRNIADEYLSLSTVHFSFLLERSKIVWLIQSKTEDWIDRMLSETTRKMTAQLVYGTFECIQSACHDLLNLPISIAIAHQPVMWTELGAETERLRKPIEGGMKRQLLFLDRSTSAELPAHPFETLPAEVFKQYEYLAYCLEQKRREDFDRVYRQLLAKGDAAWRSGGSLQWTQIASSILTVLFDYTGRLQIGKLPERVESLRGPAGAGRLDDWPGVKAILQEAVDFVFGHSDDAEKNEENRLVQSIHSYLTAHLGGDLSLKTMAMAIGHNPSYLSRLYKQKAGKGLSETVAELKLARAKELLAQPQYRIQDISQAVGFLSDHYFYRFFKKATKMTPQEYRDSLQQDA